ncbi:MAG: MFS transporter [Stagnimonas sp.]|nr:MFS transporter [Stagnimonas sp.]
MRSTVQKGTAYTLFVLFLINFLNFFDRALPGVVLEPLRKEFGLSDTMSGLLGTAFILVYAIAGIPLGRLADRLRRGKILGAGVAAWSVFTGAAAYVTSFPGLLLARLGVGVGEASCAPAANSMIGDLYPSHRRARALGLFMLGLPLGSLACFALGGWIAQSYGWRAPFLVAMVPGLIVAVLAWRLVEPQRGLQDKAALAPLTGNPFKQILSIQTVWWIIVSGAAINFAAYSLNTFLPALLVRVHGLNIAQAGGISSLVLGATGLIGLTLGGMLADKLHQAFPRGRLLCGAVALLIAAPLLWLGLTQPKGAVTALTLLLCGGWLLYFLYFVTVYPAIQDVVDARLRATAMAVYFFFQYVLGGAVGSLVTGALSDHFAKAAMSAAGATAMAPAFIAQGLQQSLALAVPVAIALTGLVLLLAARSFVADAAKR